MGERTRRAGLRTEHAEQAKCVEIERVRERENVQARASETLERVDLESA